MSPGRLLVVGYASLALTGALLLMLPVAVTTPGRLTFTEAMFTSTSAVCVTGLAVIPIGQRLSLFGQLVVLVLMQVGGMGVMTVSTLFMVLLGRRISLRGRLLVQEEIHQDYLTGLVRLVRMVAGVTLFVEGLGATLLFLAWLPLLGPGKSAYFAVFHSVSAFNNAGLDLWGTSLRGFVTDPLVVLTVAGLLMVGGIGFSVIADVSSWRPGRRLQLHSRVALTMAGVLIASGFLFVLAVEWHNPRTLGALPWWYRPMAAFFTAVTPRTAGFDVVPTGELRAATLLFMLPLMFIGVSPGSTGGGIKTTTAAVVGSAVLSALSGREDLILFNRRVPRDTLYRAVSLVILAGSWCGLAAVAILVMEPMEPLSVLFEVVSAFGTVGLSTGITPDLSTPSRWVIIATMLMGRVGPVTVAMALARRSLASTGLWRYPEERVSLG